MTAKRQIAFIDPSLVDWKTLLAGLNEDIEVVILDPSTNGLLQIAESLRGTNSVSAIHIFSHGSSGEITLGGMALNAGNLVDYGDALVDHRQRADGDRRHPALRLQRRAGRRRAGIHRATCRRDGGGCGGVGRT